MSSETRWNTISTCETALNATTEENTDIALRKTNRVSITTAPHLVAGHGSVVGDGAHQVGGVAATGVGAAPAEGGVGQTPAEGPHRHACKHTRAQESENTQ